MFRPLTSTFLWVALCVAPACRERAGLPSVKHEPADPQSRFEVGVGDRTLDLAPCVLRLGGTPRALQLVAPSVRPRAQPHLYLEARLPKGFRMPDPEVGSSVGPVGRPGGRSPKKRNAAPRSTTENPHLRPDLTLLSLGKPLAEDEDPVYLGENLALDLRLLAGQDGNASRGLGRIQGRVRDLGHGRGYEIRARFDCPLER